MKFVVYYEFDNYVFLLGFSIYDLLILKLIIGKRIVCGN